MSSWCEDEESKVLQIELPGIVQSLPLFFFSLSPTDGSEYVAWNKVFCSIRLSGIMGYGLGYMCVYVLMRFYGLLARLQEGRDQSADR